MSKVLPLILALGAAAAVLGPSAPARAAWEGLGGDIRSLPECLEVGPTDHCWGLSGGSTMTWWRDGAPTNLGGEIRGAPECVARGGEIACFAPATLPGGGLAAVAYDGEAWGPWSRIGDAKLRQKPACVIEGGEIGCVALADDTRGWWAYAPGGGEGPIRIAFPPDVASTLRPMCEVAARGTRCFMVSTAANTAGELWTILRSERGDWSDWQPLLTGAPIGETPHCLASGVKLDCFARTRPPALRLISGSFDGRSWGQWAAVGEATVQSQPFCNKLGSGFDCYYTSPSRELRRRRMVHGAWREEVSLGDGTVLARPECLANPGGAEIDCYLQGADNTLRRLEVR